MSEDDLRALLVELGASLFARGFTLLGGTRITDPLAFADAMAAGESWSAATRKFAIAREGWPGWRAMTGCVS